MYCIVHYIIFVLEYISLLVQTNIAPVNGWFETPVYVWDGFLAGAMLVSGDVYKYKHRIKRTVFLCISTCQRSNNFSKEQA